MKSDLLAAVLERQRSREPSVVLTWLGSGRQQFLADARELSDPSLREAVSKALASGVAKTFESEGETIFVHPFLPALRMIVVGAVHIAQHLVAMATRAGYAVTVVDPRRGFSTRERIPKASLSHQWPDTALAELALDRRSAVVTLSHDPKLDDPALVAALRSDAFYIGALGSRRSQAQRIDRLRAAGFENDALDRIHAPVGLPIGARSPAEIAVAILAEVTACLHGVDA